MSARARATLACGLGLLACTLLSSRALGQDRAPDAPDAPDAPHAVVRTVRVRLPECGAAPWSQSQGENAELMRALELELQGEGIRAVSADARADEEGGALLELAADCAAAREELVLHARSAAGELRTRRMDLRDVPAPLRRRALALALAELLRASMRASPPAATAQPPIAPAGSEHAASGPAPAAGRESQQDAEATAPAAAEPPAAARNQEGPEQEGSHSVASGQPAAEATARARPASASAPQASDDDDDRARHALWLAPSGRWLLSSGGGLYGAAAGWQWQRWDASVTALFGHASDALGGTSFGLVHAALGYQLLRARLGRQLLHAGPVLGGGGTWASASANSAADGGAALLPTYELALRLGLARELTGSLAAELCVDGGYARGPALRADDRALVTLSGAFLGIALRLSVTLDQGSPR